MSMIITTMETRDIPIGWLCPRCGAINAPDVKQCECEPVAEQSDGPPMWGLGPSETKEV